MIAGIIVWVVSMLLFVFIFFIRQVNEYQRGVTFLMGRYQKTKLPGWRIIIPIFQSMKKVDMRVKVADVPNQDAVTKDNISAQINAVIYYRVVDAAKAIIQVENFFNAVSQLAQTTMRNIVGEVDLDSLLSSRETISDRIKVLVDAATDQWGIKIESVELKDILLPDDMKRTIAKQAEAEREKRAVIIKAQGEVEAAENMAKAATMLSSASGALHLRTLQTIDDVSSDQSNTIIFAVPLEVLRAFENK